MKNHGPKLLFVLLMAFMLTESAYCQLISEKNIKEPKLLSMNISQDTSEKVKFSRLSVSGLFVSIGGGLSIPLGNFTDNSDVSFGILGKLEFSSTSIFPFVIGGEFTYFTYSGDDIFKTANLLGTFNTEIVSFGLSVEYCLTQFFSSAYTVPFITVDVKDNLISREYDEGANLPGFPKSESKVSFGAGLGFTIFVFDFYAKYNYMKDLSNIGVYTKIKFPLIKF